MKGITLTQPWATLVATGHKSIETRGWSTSYRGPIAIHAAKGLAGLSGGKRALRELCAREPFASALSLDGADPVDTLSFGEIVAVGDLGAVVPTDDLAPHLPWPPDEEGFHCPHELDFGNYSPGRFAWVLGNVWALRQPVPWRGALGLWELPDDFERDRSAA